MRAGPRAPVSARGATRICGSVIRPRVEKIWRGFRRWLRGGVFRPPWSGSARLLHSVSWFLFAIIHDRSTPPPIRWGMDRHYPLVDSSDLIFQRQWTFWTGLIKTHRNERVVFTLHPASPPPPPTAATSKSLAVTSEVLDQCRRHLRPQSPPPPKSMYVDVYDDQQNRRLTVTPNAKRTTP